MNSMEYFTLVSEFKPTGDQPQAIDRLVNEINGGRRFQTLLGVTGSGKTFTLANVVARINRPTLVISHNKTLAAQLYSEFRDFFPHNAVEYFVSYYDYYQPEAYIPQTDTYIEKDAAINDRLDRLRLSASTSLMSRRDTLVVSSVSCIYNLGSPDDYRDFVFYLEKGQQVPMEIVARRFVDMQYERDDYDFKRGTFRIKGDVLDIYPAYASIAYRFEFFGSEIEAIHEVDPVSFKRIHSFDRIGIYPAKHFMISADRIEAALKTIEWELEDHLRTLRNAGKELEAYRLEKRTRYDMEMMKEFGYCHGIENYSRHLSGRESGARPWSLIDYFPQDYLLVIDESHVTVPQLRGMFNGDRARKETLVEFGFRLPSCLDNRPLRFNELEDLMRQAVFVSATPGPYELEHSSGAVVEQIIRPTGLLDPVIEVRPTEGQIDDIIAEVKARVEKHQRVLITTLTKRMAEDLTQYLQYENIKVAYIHSDIKTIERSQILQDLRKKEHDCLVGVNLLREGIDLPEVSLVVILDADKEGFLRSGTSLIQIAGRAARHVEGRVLMYADTMTPSMQRAIGESNRRRAIQQRYNREHGITPRTIQKAIREGIEIYHTAQEVERRAIDESLDAYELMEQIAELEKRMVFAAKHLKFEEAAQLRDRLNELRTKRTNDV